MKFYIKDKSDLKCYLNRPQLVYDEFKHLSDADQKAMYIIGMNNKQRVKIKEMVALGGLDHTSIYPSIILKRLLVSDCTGVILIHNHPSGDPSPSSDDISLTTHIHECCKLFSIRLLDHIVIGDEEHGRYFSFAEKNILPK